jgi:hypothetical protein
VRLFLATARVSLRVQSNQSSSLLARAVRSRIAPHVSQHHRAHIVYDVVRLRVDLEHVAVSNDGFQISFPAVNAHDQSSRIVGRLVGASRDQFSVAERPLGKVHDDARWVRPIRRFEVIRIPGAQTE